MSEENQSDNDETRHSRAAREFLEATSKETADDCRSATVSALDCIEWISVFQGRYNGALGRGDLALAEEIELLFFAMWNGYGGQCCRRWCDILGIPEEDGSKVLGEEHPYFGLREWWVSRNARGDGSDR